MHHKKLAFISLLVSLCVSSMASALATDRDQPISIRSNSAERNDKAETTTYVGNVELDQGSLHITANKLIILQSKGEITKVQALGKPAHLQQRPEAGKEIVYAEGEVIDYFTSKNLLILTQNASITQDGTLVKSQRIEYLMDEEIVKAKGGNKANGDGRVHVVIPPNKSRTKPSKGGH